MEAELAALPRTEEGTQSYYAGLSRLRSFDAKGARKLNLMIILSPLKKRGLDTGC